MLVSTQEEIQQVEMERPHVVILGAGASFAAFESGDRNGKKLPLMNNLVETLGLKELLDSTGLSFASSNFEDIYSFIYSAPGLTEVRSELERRVHRYFASMELPDHPTIYDHLVLSLRPKDVIATFNWDPFLVQAIERNMHRFQPPLSLYLHGNVKIGECSSRHHMGIVGKQCQKCKGEIEPSRLLFPIGEKNYNADPFLSKQWRALESSLESAFMITLFGYGAPTSDASAIALFKKSWGSIDQRNMEEIEIIDVREEDDLVETWSPFIHSHHYRIESDFYDSFIANHPRRTGEAYLNQFLKAKFIEGNRLPKSAGFSELWEWYENIRRFE